MKLNFLLWLDMLDIHRKSKFIQSHQFVFVRHLWSCPKLCQIVIQLHLKNKLSYEVGLLLMVTNPKK